MFLETLFTIAIIIFIVFIIYKVLIESRRLNFDHNLNEAAKDLNFVKRTFKEIGTKEIKNIINDIDHNYQSNKALIESVDRKNTDAINALIKRLDL